MLLRRSVLLLPLLTPRLTPFDIPRRTLHMATHKLCMIPGPIEVHPAVAAAASQPALSHVDPQFIAVFGEVIEMLRDVHLTRTAQPFVVTGSGTLGWDSVSANLLEPGDRALVLNTGLFGDRFGECLETYGADVTHVRHPVGDRPEPAAVGKVVAEAVSQGKPFKLVTITHVDTSTGVLSDIEALTKAIKAASPKTFVVIDGVCSVAAEEIRMDEWDIDVVLTASQKALGAPPGLSIVMARPAALALVAGRKSPVANYYVAWKRWLPIMQAYEGRKAAYFGTPSVPLIAALHASLTHLTGLGMPRVFAKHLEVSKEVKDTVASWGLGFVPKTREGAAHGMTAVWYPEGVVPGTLLGEMGKQGVVIAGGLHPEIKDKYFRIGHMGVSVLEPERGHIAKTLESLKTALNLSGYTVQ